MERNKFLESINRKIIIKYNKKNKFKTLVKIMFSGTIIIYLTAFYRRGSDITITECINIFPSIIIMIALYFFLIDTIKCSLERMGVFKLREPKIEKLKKFAVEYIEKMYITGEINKQEYEELNNMYM